MATRNPTFNRIPQTTSADDFMARMDELARRNVGGFTAVGQDTPTSLPFTPSSGFRAQREQVDIGNGRSYYRNPNRPSDRAVLDYDAGSDQFIDPLTGELYGLEDIHMDGQSKIKSPYDPRLDETLYNQPPQNTMQMPEQMDDLDSELEDDFDNDPAIQQYIQPKQQAPIQQLPSQPSVLGAQARPQAPAPQQPNLGISKSISGLFGRPVDPMQATRNVQAMANKPPARQQTIAQRPIGPMPSEGKRIYNDDEMLASIDPSLASRQKEIDQYIQNIEEIEEEEQRLSDSTKDASLTEIRNRLKEMSGVSTDSGRLSADPTPTPRLQSANPLQGVRTQASNVFSAMNPIKSVEAAERPAEDEIRPNDPGQFSFNVPRAGEGVTALQNEETQVQPEKLNVFSKAFSDMSPFKRIGEATASIEEGVDSIGKKVGETVSDLGEKAQVVKGNVFSAINNAKNVVSGGGTKITKAPPQNKSVNKPAPNKSVNKPAPAPTQNKSVNNPAPKPAPTQNKSVAPRPTPAPTPNRATYAKPYTPAPKPAPRPAPAPKPAPRATPAPKPKTNVFTNIINWLFRR